MNVAVRCSSFRRSSLCNVMFLALSKELMMAAPFCSYWIVGVEVQVPVCVRLLSEELHYESHLPSMLVWCRGREEIYASSASYISIVNLMGGVYIIEMVEQGLRGLSCSMVIHIPLPQPRSWL